MSMAPGCANVFPSVGLYQTREVSDLHSFILDHPINGPSAERRTSRLLTIEALFCVRTLSERIGVL